MPAPQHLADLRSAQTGPLHSGRLSHWLQAQWWQAPPSPAAQALRPLAALYQWLAHRNQLRCSPVLPRAALLPVPVVVVGNLIVGGAGKTPTAMAVVQHLRLRGWTPGIVSRGYGREDKTLTLVSHQTPATVCGDEPLLMHLRTLAPTAVAPKRLAAAHALLAANPEVNILVADDGLQHWPLPRDVEIIVFDDRGLGNGLLLPAGPLRQAMPAHVAPHQLVLYNADQPSTALHGHMANRGLAGAVGLADWWQAQPASTAQLQALAATSHRAPLLAVAGMANPEKFFSMLEAAGCRLEQLPLPDHAAFTPLPWPATTTDVLVTEKDAVKLRPEAVGNTRVWVVALDFHLPPSFTAALDGLLTNLAPETP